MRQAICQEEDAWNGCSCYFNNRFNSFCILKQTLLVSLDDKLSNSFEMKKHKTHIYNIDECLKEPAEARGDCIMSVLMVFSD